jgi:hypothetical protein
MMARSCIAGCFERALVVVFCVHFLSASRAQVQVAERYQSLPGDSIVVASLDFGGVIDRKDLEFMPWEVYSALGKKELGIDPLLLDTIDLAIGMPSPKGPEFGAIFRTKAAVDIEDLSNSNFQPVVASPKVKDLRSRDILNVPANKPY